MAKKKEKKDAHAIESVENCDFKARVEELEVANYDFKNIDIKSMIRVVRGMHVLLDSDLAGLYGV